VRYPVGSLAPVIDGSRLEIQIVSKPLMFFAKNKTNIENRISNIFYWKIEKTKTGPQIKNTSPPIANPWASVIGMEVDEGGG